MKKVLAALSVFALQSGCVRPPLAYVETYRGDFVYSWEGGGFFLPCASDGRRVDPGLTRRFFAQLRADSIHWLPHRQPARDHEGAQTFVILRTPRLVRAPGDTLSSLFGAEVDSMRPRLPADCPSAALPNER